MLKQNQKLKNQKLNKNITKIVYLSSKTFVAHFIYSVSQAVEFDETGEFTPLEPTDIANAVLYAVTQPSHVAVNEVLIQPREMPF